MPIDVSPVSVPHLMALARGVVCQGDLRCFYCGAPCDGSNSVAEHIKETFTELRAGSPYGEAVDPLAGSTSLG